VKARSLLIGVTLAVTAGACTDAVNDGTTTSTTSGTTPSTTAAPSTSSAPPSTEDPRGYIPEFMAADCEFNVPIGTSPSCGYLVVPEDRTDPGGNQVRIHAAIFDAPGTDIRPDPIFYLEGGPGGHTLDALEFSFATSYQPLLVNRDLILFDQRGIGLSEPALDCPEDRAVEIEFLDDDVPDEVYLEAATAALIECRDRLTAAGVDLTDYNSASNAADVADLRIALGYDEINLWGISYGTRLALTIMRDHPEGIRSVTLDSTVPLDLDLYPAIPASADRAFDVFFAGCGADPVCGGEYPDLEADFYALADRLDAAPVDIVVEDFVSRDSYPALLSGEDLYGLLFNSLYADTIIPLLPSFISDAVGGDYSGLERLSSLFFTNGPFVSTGMYLSVQCNEEYIFSTPQEVVDAVDAHPDVAGLFSGAETEFDDCALWGAGTGAAVENEPVTSAIPTLVLAGGYDPITPPEYGRMAAATLANASFFEFPGLAHGVSTGADCPTQILLDFLEDPTVTPDAGCIATMGPPQFFVPGNVSVTLIPFEADVFGFIVTGVRPEEWDDSGFGAFTAPGLGDIGILQQAVPSGFFTVEAMADQLADQFGLTEAWSTGSHNDGNRTWDTLRGDDGGLIFDVGLFDDETDLFVVVLISTENVRQAYLDQVFYPALAAIQAG